MTIPARASADLARDAWLAAQGIRILRFAARDVLDDRRRPDVMATIAAAARAKGPLHRPSGGPPPPLRG